MQHKHHIVRIIAIFIVNNGKGNRMIRNNHVRLCRQLWLTEHFRGSLWQIHLFRLF